MTRTVELGSLVLPEAPICYGILMPGADSDGGVPVVKVRDYDHSGIDVGQLLRAAPNIEAPYRRSRLQPGDLLMSIRGTTGVIAVVPPELVGANITQDTARIRVDVENRDYLYQALHAPNVRRQIRLRTIGQAVKGINIGAVRKLEIPWPPKPTRDLIARILGDCDLLMRTARRLTETKRTFNRGLVQQLLTGHKRFPEFKNRPWVERPLRDFFIEKSVPNSNRVVEFVYSCTKTVGIVSQSERFGKRLASADLARYKVVETGDLVYDPMLLWDGSIGFVPESGRGVVSPAYETFSVSDDASRDYFWPLLKSYNLIHRFKQISQGTNTRRRKAHPRDFLKIIVPMPPTKDEQDRIAAVLTAAQREIYLLSALREQIEIQKKALLSKLLSGDLQASSL